MHHAELQPANHANQAVTWWDERGPVEAWLQRAPLRRHSERRAANPVVRRLLRGALVDDRGTCAEWRAKPRATRRHVSGDASRLEKPLPRGEVPVAVRVLVLGATGHSRVEGSGLAGHLPQRIVVRQVDVRTEPRLSPGR